MGAASCRAYHIEPFCACSDNVQHGTTSCTEVQEYEPSSLLDLNVSPAPFAKRDAQRGHVPMIGDTPVLPESFSDEEDSEEVTPAQVNSGIAQALQDKGDDKYDGKTDSAQSDGMEASVLMVDSDTWERASEQNPGAQPKIFWLERTAMYVESDRETIKTVDIDDCTDDVKQTSNLEWLATDDYQIRSPCKIGDGADSKLTLVYRPYIPKVTHISKAISTCRSSSSTEEEHSACLQEVSIDTDTNSIDSQILDGVWMLDDGQHVAVVNGSDVKLLGDGAGFNFQLQALGAGVWAITMDDEEFLADCSEREDGRLLLHWSDGLTWVRKEEGVTIDSVSTHKDKLQDECQSISSSSSSSLSSSSSSSDSSPTAWSSLGPVEPGRIFEALEVIVAGEAAELVPAAEASKSGKTSYSYDFDDHVYEINEADEAGGACKLDEVSQARHPSKADKINGAGEVSKSSEEQDGNKDGQICEDLLANGVGDGAVSNQARKIGKAGVADEISNASKTIDADNVNMGGKFHEAGQPSEAGKAGEIIDGNHAEAILP